MGDIHSEAENDYLLGMKYKDIAAKYGTTINTVKSWKTRYGWTKDGTKRCAHKKQIKEVQKKKDALDVGSDIEDNPELSDKEQLFCLYYSRTFNQTQSYMRVYKCEYFAAASSANRLLKKEKIRAELKRLKDLKMEHIVASVPDIAELQSRIAFADLSGIVQIDGSDAIIANTDMIDWQLVKSVKNTKYGVAIQLKDSQKAADWLLKYEKDTALKKSEEEEKEKEYAIQLTEVDMDEYRRDMESTAETSDIHEQSGG